MPDQEKLKSLSRDIISFENDDEIVGIGRLFYAASQGSGYNEELARSQIIELVRLLPISAASSLLCAILTAWSLASSISLANLVPWLGLMTGYAAFRYLRAKWFLAKQCRLTILANQPWRLALGSLIGALIYLVPGLIWSIHGDAHVRLTFCLMLTGLICGGSMTLASVPTAAMTFVWTIALGTTAIYGIMGQPALAALSLSVTLTISAASLAAWRRFNDHFYAVSQSREKSRIIELLRELGASGSDWLWEMDADQRIVAMSDAMVAAIGSKHGSPVGKLASDVLDPFGQAALRSSGMRTLLEHVRAGIAFRDLAIPVFGGTRWWSLSAIPLVGEQGQLRGWRGVGSDITETRLTGNDSVGSARRDPLTGLANRLLIREIIEEALLRHASQAHGKTTAEAILLLVDLDRFKHVNDSLGHAIGDQLLVLVARRLEQAAHDWGQVGRLGGDEFAIVISAGRDNRDVGNLASTIIAALSAPYQIGEARLQIGASIGIARGPDDGDDDLTLLRSADLSLYSAKDAGRGTYSFYQPQMLEAAQADRLFEADVRSALADGQLSLVYQPIIESASGQLVGREALLRWDHPERGSVPPDRFIPIVEDLGLIGQIGNWVIRQACADAAIWPSNIRVAVNVSVAQLTGSTLANSVISALATSGLEPGRLELEVTERIFIGENSTTLELLSNLRALGVRLVLDDFGRGYSSFGYLSRTQFAKIKIDQSFVRAAASGERESKAIVRAILTLAESLGVETTAEGVETASQATAMTLMGCSQLQGYYFGRPEKLSTVPMTADLGNPARRRG
ncbi:EAL domain-containing protein [Sphingomonas sp. RB3P16]|uniref:putative bifunctional diguanylate cyclase/phosphodiesterase n=1 Tax=Parasphingomonas frigoris TaxID=3096163 RepID=UPI002FC86554